MGGYILSDMFNIDGVISVILLLLVIFWSISAICVKSMIEYYMENQKK